MNDANIEMVLASIINKSKKIEYNDNNGEIYIHLNNLAVGQRDCIVTLGQLKTSIELSLKN
ncbi:hypothetical protein [Agarivorans albus]|uniref:hypothetical protein n=1 Tax=Agarivorans albus TaxID=182262 RepID=UPI001BFD0352|nr:hypothetical protein [Agarivorans albus]